MKQDDIPAWAWKKAVAKVRREVGRFDKQWQESFPECVRLKPIYDSCLSEIICEAKRLAKEGKP